MEKQSSIILQGKYKSQATYKDGISIQFSYLGIDGIVLESSEIIGDHIESNWNINGQKYFERRTIGGTIISIKRWYEDGTIRQEPFDWEKEKPLKMKTFIMMVKDS